jgi:hypothetical protein
VGVTGQLQPGQLVWLCTQEVMSSEGHIIGRNEPALVVKYNPDLRYYTVLCQGRLWGVARSILTLKPPQPDGAR